MQSNLRQRSYRWDRTSNTTPTNIWAMLLVVFRLLPPNQHPIPTEKLPLIWFFRWDVVCLCIHWVMQNILQHPFLICAGSAYTICVLIFSNEPQTLSLCSFSSLSDTVGCCTAQLITVFKSMPEVFTPWCALFYNTLGNKCADATAKSSAENQSGHDIHIDTDAHPHSSISWPARVGDPSPVCQPDTPNTCQPGPPAERFSIFSDLDMLWKHTCTPSTN